MADISVFSKPYGDNKDFRTRIEPFLWSEREGKFALSLNVAIRRKKKLFDTRAKEKFDGNGYDWASLAEVFIEEKMPELKSTIEFDPERDMFCVCSPDADALAKLAIAFKDACEDDALILDLFSRAPTDHILDDATIKKAFEEMSKQIEEELRKKHE